jgi:hypothetical protein
LHAANSPSPLPDSRTRAYGMVSAFETDSGFAKSEELNACAMVKNEARINFNERNKK